MSREPRTFPIGELIGPLERGPITTRQLVEYAGASLDFNRIHYDDPFAKAAGFPSVIVHGMLSMAFLGQRVAELVGGPGRIRELKARFRAVAFPGDVIRVEGEVLASQVPGTIALALRATRQDGTLVVEGSAIVTA